MPVTVKNNNNIYVIQKEIDEVTHFIYNKLEICSMSVSILLQYM